MCGGTAPRARNWRAAPGLSPRVRGNHCPLAGYIFIPGSIPACAGEPSRDPALRYQRAVYPRVCGGTSGAMRTRSFPAGLSPRVRGNHGAPAYVRTVRRSIPACAGEPPTQRPAARNKKVYPRVCGGTHDRLELVLAVRGLSPRVRGNRQQASTPILGVGSIPACAGEPAAGAGRIGNVQVYPRVCGGTTLTCLNDCLDEGLSPRVRGNRQCGRFQCSSTRSIPACAGEPLPHAPLPRHWEVYPRVCGGTQRSFWSDAARGGLSPRVRGNPRGGKYASLLLGSIPACAGEPMSSQKDDSQCPVYPRVCGGTVSTGNRRTPTAGLSPRVRGNQIISVPWLRVRGSIPACAGEPAAGHRAGGPDGVYPRVCGGTPTRSVACQQVKGLSPRVRGNPCRRWRSPTDARSIPACAGEPRPDQPSVIGL